MSLPKAMQQPLSLRLASAGFLAFWCLLAAFPIVWIAVMSFKSPVDAFSANPLDVIFGPVTRDRGDGLSILDCIAGIAVIWLSIRLAMRWLMPMAAGEGFVQKVFSWFVIVIGFGGFFIIGFFYLLPVVMGPVNAIAGPLGNPVIGLTVEH